MDPEQSIKAADLPTGTVVSGFGRIYTAFPPMPWMPSLRWLSGELILSDASLDTELARGATVIGEAPEAIELYASIIADCRDQADRR